MYINKLNLQNFMIFDNLEINFSKNINILSGVNSTGKTAIIKLLYTIMKSMSEANNAKTSLNKTQCEEIFVKKLSGVFRPDDDIIGRLVQRIPGINNTKISIVLGDNSTLNMEFSSHSQSHVKIDQSLQGFVKEAAPVYLPPKEIISATENFVSLYTDYHIAFEEIYYDLARLLERPLKRGKNTNEQNNILDTFYNIMEGSIFQKGKKFFLKVAGKGEFEMGLVSEGYRKLSTIMYLIQSGSLSKHSILFWDEPETNMNPRMIKYIVDAVYALASMGVQVFITTHNYFLQQEFSLLSEYPDKNQKLNINFISLYEENKKIVFEEAPEISKLSHNAIMEEFNELYDREQEKFYDNSRE